MKLLPLLLNELKEEGATTRKFLELVPDDKHDWKPHEKSMKMIALATHIAELPTWVPLAINTAELDFAKSGYNPVTLKNKEELLAYFDKNLAEGIAALETADEEKLISENWKLRSGDVIHVDTTKYGMIRVAFSQTIHHRAQLGVFFRLLGIALPNSYGPTADTQSFL